MPHLPRFVSCWKRTAASDRHTGRHYVYLYIWRDQYILVVVCAYFWYSHMENTVCKLGCMGINGHNYDTLKIK